jgi:hypothetical protein
MNILLCSHPGCVSNASISCRKDPFGKSDEYVSYCPKHAPGMLRGIQVTGAHDHFHPQSDAKDES